MKEKHALLARSINWWRSIHLVDRLLLIFMIILLLHSARSLFFPMEQGEASDTLCAALRTTSASIFGYFISAGFQNTSEHNTKAAQTKNVIDGDKPQQSTEQLILTSTPVANIETKILPSTDQSGSSSDQRLQQQLIIAAVIGSLSLLMLVTACGHSLTSPDAIASLSQLRDFVSGSVGFLIGHAGTAQK